jgi:hypothetical protein
MLTFLSMTGPDYPFELHPQSTKMVLTTYVLSKNGPTNFDRSSFKCVSMYSLYIKCRQ